MITNGASPRRRKSPNERHGTNWSPPSPVSVANNEFSNHCHGPDFTELDAIDINEDQVLNDRLRWKDTILLKVSRFIKVCASLLVMAVLSSSILDLVQEIRYRSLTNRNLIVAKTHQLEPLSRQIDLEQFTIRMNTWRRNEQLLVSVNHHATCAGVAQIQIVWCDSENDPPRELTNHPSKKVVVERHSANSLNERFNPILPPATVGVLSLDDDILWPCEALDSGFFRWTRFPDRMVGYDPRLHVFNNHIKEWEYKHQYPTQRYNKYSLTLTRAAFLHRDYLYLYSKYAPERIKAMVTEEFNCEDIAMSLFVSYVSNFKLPLLVDRWARSSSVELVSGAKISTGVGHSRKRNNCTSLFLYELDGLISNLHPHVLIEKKRNIFEDGVSEEEASEKASKEYKDDSFSRAMTEREVFLKETISTWKTKNYKKKREEMYRYALADAYERGLIEDTIPWTKRFNTTLQNPSKPRFAQLFPHA